MNKITLGQIVFCNKTGREIICEETAQFLRGLLLNHQDYLDQQAEGEPWEPEERECTESLLAMLEPVNANSQVKD
jgi:hypothetical protein